MLNPIFWKKVQGQKHPGRWGVVEHQIPSTKVLFKTNTKSHKHPGITLLSSESKTQLVNLRKQKLAFNPGTAHSPEIQSYRMWWGAASPILNDTPDVCIYTSYNRIHIKMHIYIYIFITELPDGKPVPRLVVNGMERKDVPVPWERSNSHPHVRVQKSCVNQFIWAFAISRGRN